MYLTDDKTVPFDPSKHSLGKPCKQGHLYGETGKTMRYQKGSKTCVLCARDYNGKSLSRPEARQAKNELATRWVKLPDVKERQLADARRRYSERTPEEIEGSAEYKKRHGPERDDFASLFDGICASKPISFHCVSGIWFLSRS